MSLYGIIFYTLRAFAFAVPVTLIAALLKFVILKRADEPFEKKREMVFFIFIFYCSALIEITAIRDGAHLLDWWTLPHGMETVQLIPILTTLAEIKNGAWAFIYPIIGNMIWFIPFGILLGMMRPDKKAAKIILAGGCISIGIEFLQWVLQSGISDVDDVILNICGTAIGYMLYFAATKKLAG